MAERRLGLPVAERDAYAWEAVKRLIALAAFNAAQARAAAEGTPARLSGYIAIRGELDPAKGLELARAAGFDVVLPRIDPSRPPRLTFHLISGPDDLGDGPHGLTEPRASCPEMPVGGIDVMLVPGLAFDAAGHRLGFGGGYYDDAGRRMRESGSRGIMVGLAYDFQVVDECPAGVNDVSVDYVVTERRVLTAGVAS
jgi:5-formyltetrahydrofolate cyclo-ligase